MPEENNHNKTQTIFVIGNSRSGTSMTARILGNHSSIFSFNELHFFEELWNPNEELNNLDKNESTDLLLKLFSIQFDGYFHYSKNEKFQPEASEVLNGLKELNIEPNAITLFQSFTSFVAKKEGKQMVCEQTPRNAYFINEIRKCIPNAKFIYLIRDPRDVLKSQKNRWKRNRYKEGKKHSTFNTIRQRINYHPITISKLWSHASKVFTHNSEKDDLLIVKYEDLILKPELEVKKICDFVGVAYDNHMLQIPKIGSSLKQDESNKTGIDSSKAQGWKKGGLTKGEIRICENITAKGMAQYGYPPSNTKYHASELFYYLIFPFQILLTLIFNVKKTKSLVGAIRKRFLY